MNRRQLLTLLGIGSISTAGAVGYHVGTDDENPEAELKAFEISDPTETLASINYDQLYIETETQKFSLLTDPISDSIEDHPRFSRINAAPAKDRKADRIELTMASGSNPDIAISELQTLLNIGAETTAQSTIGGQVVEFSGGKTGTQAALLASFREPSPKILMARGSTTDAAEYAATNWSL